MNEKGFYNMTIVSIVGCIITILLLVVLSGILQFDDYANISPYFGALFLFFVVLAVIGYCGMILSWGKPVVEESKNGI